MGRQAPSEVRARRFDPAHDEGSVEGRIRSACRRHRARRIIVATKSGRQSAFAGRMGGGSEMSEKIYDVPAEWAKRAFIDKAKYSEMYARSIGDPNAFWAEQAKRIGGVEPFIQV